MKLIAIKINRSVAIILLEIIDLRIYIVPIIAAISPFWKSDYYLEYYFPLILVAPELAHQ